MERIRGIKIEKPEQGERLIFFPVRCFCCWDSGIARIPAEIYDHLIEGEQDKPVICQRVSCEAGQKYLTAYNATEEERKTAKSPLAKQQYQNIFDVRLNSVHCEAIHQYQLDLWVKSRQTGNMVDNQNEEF